MKREQAQNINHTKFYVFSIHFKPKSELQRLLGNYPVKYYDASYKKYGLGATEVYIYQNPN